MVAVALMVAALASPAIAPDSQSPVRQAALRQAAERAGVVALEQIRPEVDPELAEIGAVLFQSTRLSLNGDTSCQTCHLDRFASADGLPNAVGTRGQGEGRERLAHGGDIVPRNVLALWGRGSRGFNTFFWDGKVQLTDEGIVSQFGQAAPSDDPLVVAVHLPFVEQRELVRPDDAISETYEHEDVAAAAEIYAILAERVRRDPELGPPLANAAGVDLEEIEFFHVAEAVAAFIRTRFTVTETPFHSFVAGEDTLNAAQVRGGLLFYGKARCGTCHSGPLMSDLAFKVMPFPQVGFGRNGFGVDYGRFNFTRDPEDLYRFRTPPLINVTRTGPWSHSGAVADLRTMVRLHVDPLHAYSGRERNERQRREDLARIIAWGAEAPLPEPLSDSEIDDIVSFLASLETPAEREPAPGRRTSR
jgi:cytochrome c peroxidase